MKRIDSMSDQEIYNLTDEEVDRFIRIRYAEEGIKFLEEPPILKLAKNKSLSFEKYAYVLDNLGIAVMNQDDAIKVSNFLSNFDIYKTGYDFTLSQDVIDKKIEIYNIKHIPVFDTKRLEDYKAIEAANRKIREKHEKEVKEYKGNLRAMQNIYNEIWGKVNEVRARLDEWNRLKKIFVNEYLPLVDGDTDKAMIFFKKAYGDNEDMVRYIMEGIHDYPLFNNKLD